VFEREDLLIGDASECVSMRGWRPRL
jgi:hypothetical protein